MLNNAIVFVVVILFVLFGGVVALGVRDISNQTNNGFGSLLNSLRINRRGLGTWLAVGFLHVTLFIEYPRESIRQFIASLKNRP